MRNDVERKIVSYKHRKNNNKMYHFTYEFYAKCVKRLELRRYSSRGFEKMKEREKTKKIIFILYIDIK